MTEKTTAERLVKYVNPNAIGVQVRMPEGHTVTVNPYADRNRRGVPMDTIVLEGPPSHMAQFVKLRMIAPLHVVDPKNPAVKKAPQNSAIAEARQKALAKQRQFRAELEAKEEAGMTPAQRNERRYEDYIARMNDPNVDDEAPLLDESDAMPLMEKVRVGNERTDEAAYRRAADGEPLTEDEDDDEEEEEPAPRPKKKAKSAKVPKALKPRKKKSKKPKKK